MERVDTSVVFYAVSTAEDEQTKRDVGRRVLARPDLAALRRFPVAVTTPEVMAAAMDLSRRFTFSYWDASILEAARSLGCDVVLSADMSHGQDHDGERVRNPFVGTP